VFCVSSMPLGKIREQQTATGSGGSAGGLRKNRAVRLPHAWRRVKTALVTTAWAWNMPTRAGKKALLPSPFRLRCADRARVCVCGAVLWGVHLWCRTWALGWGWLLLFRYRFRERQQQTQPRRLACATWQNYSGNFNESAWLCDRREAKLPRGCTPPRPFVFLVFGSFQAFRPGDEARGRGAEP